MQNNEKNKPNGKVQKTYLPTKITLTIHTLIGVYLLYTAYSLVDALKTNTGKSLIFLAAFMLVFVVVGGMLIVHSVRGLMTGKYVGGALDPEENEVYDIPGQDAEDQDDSEE